MYKINHEIYKDKLNNHIYLIYLDVFMCIFTPRLCNKNKKITYEQINRKHKTYLRLHRYTYGLNKKQYNYTSPIFFPLMDQNTMCVFGCVLCFVPLLIVHLRSVYFQMQVPLRE